MSDIPFLPDDVLVTILKYTDKRATLYFTTISKYMYNTHHNNSMLFLLKKTIRNYNHLDFYKLIRKIDFNDDIIKQMVIYSCKYLFYNKQSPKQQMWRGGLSHNAHLIEFLIMLKGRNDIPRNLLLFRHRSNRKPKFDEWTVKNHYDKYNDKLIPGNRKQSIQQLARVSFVKCNLPLVIECDLCIDLTIKGSQFEKVRHDKYCLLHNFKFQ